MLQFDSFSCPLYNNNERDFIYEKILILFTLFIITLFTFVQKACAEELYKFTSANFDTSNSIIVLSGQDTPSGAALQNIKLVKMENPSRAYFDIDSSIITFPKQDWKFQSGGIKEVKINQFSTNPNVVRVVMYFDNDFNPDNIKFLRIKNNIIIKLKTVLCVTMNIFITHTGMSILHQAIFMNI